MRTRIAAVIASMTVLSALLGVPSPCAAQGRCKPDVTQVDKISNKKVEFYSQQLFATSFMASMWNAQETYITLNFLRNGDDYALQLRVEKKEGSVDRAVFESQYRGAVGQPIQLGFTSGDPLEIVVTNVGNNSQMTGFLSDSRRVTTTVILAAELKGDDLVRAREAFTARQVKAVRVHLAGSVGLTKDVDDKLGRQLMQKANCFFEGLVIPGRGSMAAAALIGSAPGKYMFMKGNGTTGDFTELRADGKFSLSEGGRVVTGTYTLQGDALTLQIPSGPSLRAKLTGNTIVQPDGTVLEKSDPGIGTPAVGITVDYATSASGKYVIKKGAAKPGDYISLEPTGKFFVQQNGKVFVGTYTVQGDALILVAATGQATKAGTFSGNTLTDPGGWVWEKAAEAPQSPGAALTIDKIIQMVNAKIPDDIVISSIDKSGTKFNLTPEDMIRLKEAGVSDAVLRAMAK